jgi:hypothetical protein
MDSKGYYMTFSSFLSYPGIVIRHSTDLVNWAPVGPAPNHSLGTICALDLCKHDGRYTSTSRPRRRANRGRSTQSGPTASSYDCKASLGPGRAPENVRTYQYAEEQTWTRRPQTMSSARVRLTNVENVGHVPRAVWHRVERPSLLSLDGGKTWAVHDTRMKVSGIHHNVFSGLPELEGGRVRRRRRYCAAV